MAAGERRRRPKLKTMRRDASTLEEPRKPHPIGRTVDG